MAVTWAVFMEYVDKRKLIVFAVEWIRMETDAFYSKSDKRLIKRRPLQEAFFLLPATFK